MTKEHILNEIRRTAQANGGTPLGLGRFTEETGIRLADIVGKYWARWGDAVREAGFVPNEFTFAYEDSTVLDFFAKLTREIGRVPALTDLKLKARNDSDFPSPSVFDRFESKENLVKRLLAFCQEQGGYEDVIRLCEGYVPRKKKALPEESIPETGTVPEPEFGFVYLMKSGRYYKIGRTNSVGRREYELGIQLPEPITLVHEIRTDDPVGIEAYWHKRFESKRRNGEWFELDAAEVAAFKRRKFM